MLFAAITASASGNNSIVSAVTGRRIRILGYVLTFAGSVNAEWMDGTTAISGLLRGTAGANIVCPVCPPVAGSQLYWLATSQTSALQLNLSAATAVSGHLVYDLIA